MLMTLTRDHCSPRGGTRSHALSFRQRTGLFSYANVASFQTLSPRSAHGALARVTPLRWPLSSITKSAHRCFSTASKRRSSRASSSKPGSQPHFSSPRCDVNWTLPSILYTPPPSIPPSIPFTMKQSRPLTLRTRLHTPLGSLNSLTDLRL